MREILNWALRSQISNILAAVIAYTAVCYLLYPLWGETVIVLSMLPVIVVAWQFGMVAGFLSGVLFFPFNTFLMNLIARPGWDVLIRTTGSVMTSFLLLVIGTVVGSMRDMNEEQRRMVEERRQAAEKIESLLSESQKANEELKKLDQAKDEFFSIVTHDLELPLVSVLGYADVLQEEIVGEVNDKQRSALSIIKKHAKILQGMIDSILDYTRLTFDRVKLDHEVFSINSQIAEMVHEMRLQFDSKRIHVDVILPSDDAMVKGDKAMIGRVLFNLLSNAIRYTPEGGNIRILIDREREFVRVAVEDNGVGIPRKKLGRLFEKFYIIKDEEARLSRRLGLGLYISKGFVEAHGGKIWADSEGPGKGARFAFTLPSA